MLECAEVCSLSDLKQPQDYSLGPALGNNQCLKFDYQKAQGL